MAEAPRCPQCGTAIQEHWDWCHTCGFDPEGLKPVGWQPQAAAPSAPPGGPSWAVAGEAPPPPPMPPPGGFGNPSPPPPGGPVPPGGFGNPSAPPPFAGAPGYGAPGYGAPPPYGYAPPPAPKPKSALRPLLVILGLVAVVAVLLIGAVTLLGKNATWSTYRAPGGEFSVDMPGTVKEETVNRSIGLVPLDIRIARTNLVDEEYFVYWYDLPAQAVVDDPTSALRDEANGVFDGLNGSITSSTATTLQGRPALKVTGDVQNGKETATGIFVLDDQRVLFFATGERKAGDGDPERFLGSIQLGA